MSWNQQPLTHSAFIIQYGLRSSNWYRNLRQVKQLCLGFLFQKKSSSVSITKYNNSSTPGPDKLSWRYLKSIIKDKICLKEIINIANTCFELGHWSSYFKTSITIVIPKFNKESYDSPKSFRSIILLNTLGKLIEKVIGECFQFHVISNNFIY